MTIRMGMHAVSQRHREEDESGLARLILGSDGVKAVVQFCTTGEDDYLASGDFHTLEKDGWYPDVLCASNGACPLCDRGYKTRPMFGAWCYVRDIFEPDSGNRVSKGQLTRLPGGPAYRKRSVNGFRVFFQGFGCWATKRLVGSG